MLISTLLGWINLIIDLKKSVEKMVHSASTPLKADSIAHHLIVRLMVEFETS
jgi:hypothetical protein